MDVRDGCTASRWRGRRKRIEPIWLFRGRRASDFKRAWADPVSGKVFCLSEAPSADATKRIHERAGHPTDQVFEVPVTA